MLLVRWLTYEGKMPERLGKSRPEQQQRPSLLLSSRSTETAVEMGVVSEVVMVWNTPQQSGTGVTVDAAPVWQPPYWQSCLWRLLEK